MPSFHPQIHGVHTSIGCVCTAWDSRSERLGWSPCSLLMWETLMWSGFSVFFCNVGAIFPSFQGSCGDNKMKSLRQKRFADTTRLGEYEAHSEFRYRNMSPTVVRKKRSLSWGTWLAPSIDRGTLGLGVMKSSPTLGVEITQIKKL